ncbi:hypothetical protein SAY86_031328 [Trapa natans]|uniref:Uncharacterized protein n=1 Tax=Trapa natans TaxID=22666 RepID=A0AAN7M7F6_TRANT|nr:hypothetical protein SAY86_031328 [Trapa natans]
MDWNLRAPSWGFDEFAQETLPNINEAGSGSSSFGGNSEATGDFSVDLKLGQVSNPVNEQAEGKWKIENSVSKKASSSQGSTKRPRGANDGAQFSTFCNPHVYPSAALEGNCTWIRMDNLSNEEGILYNHHHQQMPVHLGMHSLIPGSSSGIYGEGGEKQSPLLQGHQTDLESSSFSQPLHTESGGWNSRNNDMFYDGMLTMQVQDSDCALSLLSSPQMQTTRVGMMRPLIPPGLLGGGNHTQGLVPVDSVLVSSHGSEANIECHGGMFHMGSHGPTGNEASQTLPFHWD